MSKNEIDDTASHGQTTYEADPGSRAKLGAVGRCMALGVAAWALHLFISYSLVEWHCQNLGTLSHGTTKILLNTLTVAFLVLAVVAALISKRYGDDSIKTDPSETGKRPQFMARFSALLCGFLAVVILVQGLPNVMVGLCY